MGLFAPSPPCSSQARHLITSNTSILFLIPQIVNSSQQLSIIANINKQVGWFKIPTVPYYVFLHNYILFFPRFVLISFLVYLRIFCFFFLLRIFVLVAVTSLLLSTYTRDCYAKLPCLIACTVIYCTNRSMMFIQNKFNHFYVYYAASIPRKMSLTHVR